MEEVKSLCNKLCKSKVEADDLCQHVLYKICRNGCCIEHPGSLKTWVHNVVVNAFIDVHRRAKRETPFSYLKEPTCLYDTEGNEICVRNYTLGLDESIVRSCERLSVELSPAEREVMKQTFIQGFSSKDVCENMNISSNVLAKMKNRAIKKMKEGAKLSDLPPSWLS